MEPLNLFLSSKSHNRYPEPSLRSYSSHSKSSTSLHGMDFHTHKYASGKDFLPVSLVQMLSLFPLRVLNTPALLPTSVRCFLKSTLLIHFGIVSAASTAFSSTSTLLPPRGRNYHHPWTALRTQVSISHALICCSLLIFHSVLCLHSHTTQQYTQHRQCHKHK